MPERNIMRIMWSGTLTELEKELLFNRKAQEVGKEKQQKIYLSIISVILLLLLGTFAPVGR